MKRKVSPLESIRLS